MKRLHALAVMTHVQPGLLPRTLTRDEIWMSEPLPCLSTSTHAPDRQHLVAYQVLALIMIPLLMCACICCCRFLTDEGIEFLREYLNLPSEIVPATLKKSTRPLERGGP